MDATHTKRVLVLQGGGALGAYQAGVYEVLEEAGFEPDWLAGTSIGAVNAALIAGNPKGKRIDALKSFWQSVSATLPLAVPFQNTKLRALISEGNAAWIAATGVPGFFVPRVLSPYFAPPGSDGAVSFYDTSPLKATLESLVDFDRINAKEIRLSLGAVDVESGELRFFDNEMQKIGPAHIMASGALPPGFPPVEVDGRYYWDGGVVSNTPVGHVLSENPRGDLLIFQVDLFNAKGALPRTILDAAEREKDIRYSSRTRHNVHTTLELHEARMALRALLDVLPETLRNDRHTRLLRELAEEHCVRVVQLIYRRKPYEGSAKDYEFSRATMEEHWQAGIADARHALRDPDAMRCKPTKHMEIIDSTRTSEPHDT
jgi:NTE family protein